MAVLFQVLSNIFLFCTLFMGILLLRGNIFFGVQGAHILTMVCMPAYLILTGIMVGNLVSMIWLTKEEKADSHAIKEKIYKHSFLIGIGVGIVLALSYLFI